MLDQHHYYNEKYICTECNGYGPKVNERRGNGCGLRLVLRSWLSRERSKSDCTSLWKQGGKKDDGMLKGLTQVGRCLCEWGGTEHKTQPTRGRGRGLILRTGLRIPLTLEVGEGEGEREEEGRRGGWKVNIKQQKGSLSLLLQTWRPESVHVLCIYMYY